MLAPTTTTTTFARGLGPSLALGELRGRIVSRVLARMLMLRRIFAPLLLVFALWIAWVDSMLWRQLVLGLVALILIVAVVADTIVSRMLARGELDEPPLLVLNLVGIGVIQQIMFFATGGVASPFMPLLLPAVFMFGLIAPRRVVVTMLLAFHLPLIWTEYLLASSATLELLPDVLRGPMAGGPSPSGLLLVALVMSAGLTLATFVSTNAAQGLEAVVDDVVRSRERALQLRTEQNHELSALSAEIAHELKNPLASIKGLAQLVHRQLERRVEGERAGAGAADQRAHERLGVLRREVDRMQAILDEFLNFSRPLVPLSQREVELRELVEHVIDLHEAMAGERRVELELRDRPHGQVSCDPRKIEQILINLVQNALDEAGPDTVLELELRAGPDEGVEIAVRDQGPGLAPELGERVFELGVTGKREGSGLGLTVARALARQHGGELSLANRSDGQRGCEARLCLPRRPPAPTPPAGQRGAEGAT